MSNCNVSFSLSLPHLYDHPLIHRLRETHRAAIKVIQRMRYFVAKKRFQVRLTRFLLTMNKFYSEIRNLYAVILQAGNFISHTVLLAVGFQC